MDKIEGVYYFFTQIQVQIIYTFSFLLHAYDSFSLELQKRQIDLCNGSRSLVSRGWREHQEHKDTLGGWFVHCPQYDDAFSSVYMQQNLTRLYTSSNISYVNYISIKLLLKKTLKTQVPVSLLGQRMESFTIKKKDIEVVRKQEQVKGQTSWAAPQWGSASTF